MDDADANPLSVQRNIILGLLLALAATSWAVLVWQNADVDMDLTMASSTMGLRAPLFLTIWVIMMVAMMFPTAAPMILTFHKVQAGKRRRGDAFVSPPMPARLPPGPLPRAPRYRRSPRRASAERC
jgi:predicted metal-binding membrane protein